MALSLAEMRKKLLEQENRQPGNFSESALYPHWNIPDNTTATVRFLPDADNNNDWFWIERLLFKFPFPSVKGDPTSKALTIQVPCMEMWGENCPVLKEVRTWFKDKSMEEMGRKYWKKKSFLYQGFVRSSPLQEEGSPENPIRRFIIAPRLHDLIRDVLKDPEVMDLPTDYDKGLDFRIKKVKGPMYPEYGTSSWARNPSALTQAERAAIDEYKLFDLKEFLPKKPTDVELAAIVQLFEDSVDQKPYDQEKYGQFFRMGGTPASPDAEPTTVVPVAAIPAAVAETPAEEAPWHNDADDDSAAEPIVTGPNTSKKAQDILAHIQAMRGSKKTS